MRIRLEPNETRTVEKAGYSVYILDAPGVIEVTIDNESEELQAGQGIPSNGVMFKSVRLVNVEAVAQTIDLHIASNNRGIISNRLAGSVLTSEQAADTFNGLPEVAITGAAQTIAGNLNRRQLLIVADQGNAGVIWIGTSVAGVGIPLPPGAIYEGRLSGELELIGTNAGDVLNVAEVV